MQWRVNITHKMKDETERQLPARLAFRLGVTRIIQRLSGSSVTCPLTTSYFIPFRQREYPGPEQLQLLGLRLVQRSAS